ncbi:AMP-binding protein [Dactylosporangium sp. McL0621]|uniref:AMP-binding protein n=1 Tax=Dactylosporangium sp. McL0621 TaxID=3415678 RepID=UPI003CF315AF
MSAVLSLIERNISNRTAITGDDRSVTYAQLWQASGQLAAGLRPGQRVAYRDRNRTDFWELFIACLRAGATLVPINFRLTADEAAWIARDAGIGEVFDDAPVMIMYSSGTTGRPKGVLIDDEQLAWTVGAFGALFEVDEHAVSLVPTPYHHIAGTGWSLITLAAGGTIVQNAEPAPASMSRQLVDFRATHAAMVPTLIQALTDAPADFSALRHIVYGGAPITPALVGRATEVLGARLHQSYGLTETTGVATVLDPEEHRPDGRLTSVGRPLPGLDVRVAGGEILVRGPSVTRGYWRGESIVDGWLHTGDGGSFDEDGYLYLHDRIKDMIVSGGENVYPAEVERVLAAHPHVLDVAVVGVPSARWGESPIAVVVTNGAVDDLIPWSRERLAHYKCPVAVHVVETLPRNASGKILKRLLRKEYAHE